MFLFLSFFLFFYKTKKKKKNKTQARFNEQKEKEKVQPTRSGRRAQKKKVAITPEQAAAVFDVLETTTPFEQTFSEIELSKTEEFQKQEEEEEEFEEQEEINNGQFSHEEKSTQVHEPPQQQQYSSLESSLSQNEQEDFFFLTPEQSENNMHHNQQHDQQKQQNDQETHSTVSSNYPPEVLEAHQRLLQFSVQNDYFALMEIDVQYDPTTKPAIARKFDELCAKYDPVLFFFDTEQQQHASRKLEVIKELYKVVFERESSFKLYKRFTTLRKEYRNLLESPLSKLDPLRSELLQLASQIESETMPHELLDEIHQCLELISIKETLESNYTSE
jgi:hypothetical protein